VRPYLRKKKKRDKIHELHEEINWAYSGMIAVVLVN
jgi:hypothetical protein